MGGKLGKIVSRLIGHGDYTVVENSLSTVGKAIAPGETIPEFSVKGTETRVRHREFITDIVTGDTPTAFLNRAFVINVGDAKTFPWLSQLARQYQQYKINGLVFEFKTSTSDVSTIGTMGTVIMATNYDVTLEEFADKMHMENNQFSVSAKPSFSQIHTVECAPDMTAAKLLYVRAAYNRVDHNLDARFSDLGLFQLATHGLSSPAKTAIGELWVSYDVSLYKPSLVKPFITACHIYGYDTVGSLMPFGLKPHVYGTPIICSADTMHLPQPGCYMLYLYCEGTLSSGPTVSIEPPPPTCKVVCSWHSKDISVDSYIIDVDAMTSIVIRYAKGDTVTNFQVILSPYTEVE